MDKHDADMTKRIAAIAHAVRDRRAAMGLSQLQASKLANVGRSTWIEIENAASLKDDYIYGRVAKVLELTLADVMNPESVNDLKQLDADMLAELRLMRAELQRLGAAYEQLAQQPLAPSSPAAPASPAEARGVRQSRPSGPRSLRP